MKKCLNLSLIYAIVGLLGGVFFREFSKMNGFTGKTVLANVHTHLLMLGMVVFLIVALFCAHFKKLPETKGFKVFLIVYNVGVAMTVVMMAVRGVTEVLGLELTRGANGAISGISGVSHIIVAAGIVRMILCLKRCAKTEEA